MFARVRDDLLMRASHGYGRPMWVLCDPLARRFFYFFAEERELLLLLDGRRSLAAVKAAFEAVDARRKLDLRRLEHLIWRWHREGLVTVALPGQDRILLERAAASRRQQRWSSLSSLLAIRLPGVNAEPLLRLLTPAANALLHPFSVCCGVALMLSAVLLAATQWPALQGRLPRMDQFFAVGNFWRFIGVFVVVKVLHELGHALSCRRFGGECREIGVMLLVFTPCLYCDVSSSWMLPSRWKRICVSAAGIYVELTLAACCAWVWWFSRPGAVNTICLQVMLLGSLNTVLINGNPLLRYDGYYILSDAIGIPNLWQESRRRIWSWLSGLLWLRYDERREAGHSRGWAAAFECVYGVASMLYRWIVLAGICWFLHVWLKPRGLQPLAFALTAMAVVATVVGPVHKALVFLGSPIMRRQLSPLRLAVSLAVVGGLTVFSMTVPLPHRITAPALLEARDSEAVYVTVAGRVIGQRVSIGDRVTAGDTLIVIENLELQRSKLALDGELEKVSRWIDHLEVRRSSDLKAAAELPAARKRAADLEGQLAQLAVDMRQLTICAPRSGVILPPPTRDLPVVAGQLRSWSGSLLDKKNAGCFAATGTLVCSVGSEEESEAMLYVSQKKIEGLRTGQSVRLVLDHQPRDPLSGRVEEIAQLESGTLSPRQILQLGLELTMDDSGASRPADKIYQARVRLSGDCGELLLGARGAARIELDRRTLSWRLQRLIRETFVEL